MENLNKNKTFLFGFYIFELVYQMRSELSGSYLLHG